MSMAVCWGMDPILHRARAFDMTATCRQPLCPTSQICGMAALDLLELAAFDQLLERIGPRRAEQPVGLYGAPDVRAGARVILDISPVRVASALSPLLI